jgi:starch phosphorylase
MEQQTGKVAYFSMEIALKNEIPNYAGGLGVLAADTLLSCADLGLDLVGVSLIYHSNDDPEKGFDPARFMKRREETVTIEIQDRIVQLDIWQMDLEGKSGKKIPILFLSANNEKNQQWDRDLTKHLYAADGYTRLCQEMILGIGGVRALEATGFKDIAYYHMNEGHSVTLVMELLRKNSFDQEKVKRMCTFTSHTPIPAGHDYFDYDLAFKTLGKMVPPNVQQYATKERLGMTELALNMSIRSNSVSQRHNAVCISMFPWAEFENVTNGIYHPRWAGKEIKKVLNKELKGWQNDPNKFSKAVEKLPDKEIDQAHQAQKKELIDWINSKRKLFPFEKIVPDDLFSEDVLTIGFARRFVPYKRHTLIFKNIDALRSISYKKIQLIYAGKCHRRDEFCNSIINEIQHYASVLRGQIKVVVLKDYNLNTAKRLVTGCDVWLNNPIPPREASGTSGMKAALNGCLNISILDGWWIEGYKMEPKSGWAFGKKYLENNIISQLTAREKQDNEALLRNLEDAIDCYYNRHDEWIEKMKHAISLVSHFNTHRMVQEYYKKMWQ